MTRRMNALMLIGVLGTPIAGAQLGLDYGRAVWGDDRIWWTPPEQALSLQQSRERVEVYLNDQLLQAHLSQSPLTGLGEDGLAYFVEPDRFRIRLDNWHQVRAQLLHRAVYSAFALGVSLTCLVVGVAAFFRQPAPRRRLDVGRSQATRR